MSAETEGVDRLPTNMRLLLIMEAFANSRSAMTPTEVNAKIGLPKQSIHRLCQTLLQNGFLSRDIDPKRLRPARRARAMASGIFANSHLHIARRQVLKQLSLQIGETVNYVVPEADGMAYIDRVDSHWPLRFQLPVGSHVPFHCTASGKVFLASVGKRARERLAHSLDLQGSATNTITEMAQLIDELERVARQGYALDNEEFMDDMVAAAVPVRDSRGNFCAALAFHAPRQRVEIDGAVEHVPQLQNAAERLSQLVFSEEAAQSPGAAPPSHSK